ncbi:glycoside hydrolase family 78 protein [Penicillium lagena]|uniref:glycoside hydrolase family 78 protein n=1 Tax=Penicillium lagena TaxID=94218 RepID=UPI002540D4A2|nr:glycoside hydrolase family 78 protein [Penicillium lagena]KAJ5605310.1 glycoside hydrolase family 78 protein [Penicillium lagena]
MSLNQERSRPTSSREASGGNLFECSLWQSIRVLTEGQVTFSEIGFIPTIDLVDLDNLPSTFNSSNPRYNKIWKLGANAASAACFDAESQRSTWDVTDDGAYIRGQKAGTSVFGLSMKDYTMSFESKIVRGGTGWAISQPIGNTGVLLLLISNLPQNTSIANTNRTLTPPNSLVVASGWGFVNQTTLDSQAIGNFPLPFEIEEEHWYSISTTLLNGTQLSVAIEGQQVLNISLSHYGVAPQSTGGWGFGPYQDQIAFVKNVTVHASNGTLVYQNNMTGPSILSEYGVRHNVESICMDGAKRDRLMSIDPQMGYNTSSLKLVTSSYNVLGDYQVLGLLAFTGYFRRSGDVEWAREVWPAFQKQISWMISQVNSTTHLVDFGQFIGPPSGTAVSAALVQELNEAAEVGDALDDKESAAVYRKNAVQISEAINELLWNAKLGAYMLTTSSNTSFSVAGVAFAISSGVANKIRATSSLAKLAVLKLAPGYKDDSTADAASANISPNTNGFLLLAALMAEDTSMAKYLLDNLWAAMLSDKYGSGASWEYVGQNSAPGLSLFTSLSHPWCGAATYVLTEYIAGIRALTTGHKTWIIQPSFRGFDLDWVAVTRYGQLSMKWTYDFNILTVEVTAPRGTSGKLKLPEDLKVEEVVVNGKKKSNSDEISLQSGRSTVMIQCDVDQHSHQEAMSKF